MDMHMCDCAHGALPVERPFLCPCGRTFEKHEDYYNHMVEHHGSPATMAELACTLWPEHGDEVTWTAWDDHMPSDGELEAFALGHDPGEVYVDAVMETHCDEREMYVEAKCRMPVYRDRERTEAYYRKYIDTAVTDMRKAALAKIDEYVARLGRLKVSLITSVPGIRCVDGGIRGEDL